jgi:hypothetical protein
MKILADALVPVAPYASSTVPIRSDPCDELLRGGPANAHAVPADQLEVSAQSIAIIRNGMAQDKAAAQHDCYERMIQEEPHGTYSLPQQTRRHVLI